MADQPYYTFNREERNHAAIVYHLLLSGTDNLSAFLRLVGHDVEPDLRAYEVYFEYAFLRDHWKQIEKKSDEAQKLAFLSKHVPARLFSKYSTRPYAEFNSFFRVRSSKPSPDYIQSPANWVTSSIEGLNAQETIAVNELKWCFNLKPDLVIQTPTGKILSIEAKMESGQDHYKCELPGDAHIKGKTHSLSQVECQRLMFTKMLGVPESDVFTIILSKRPGKLKGVTYVTWSDVYRTLRSTNSHPFVDRWVEGNTVFRVQGRNGASS